MLDFGVNSVSLLEGTGILCKVQLDNILLVMKVMMFHYIKLQDNQSCHLGVLMTGVPLDSTVLKNASTRKGLCVFSYLL